MFHVKSDPFQLTRKELVHNLHLSVHAVQQFAVRRQRINKPSRNSDAFRKADNALRRDLAERATLAATLPAWFATRPGADFFVTLDQDLILPCYFGSAPRGRAFTARTLMSRIENLMKLERRRIAQLCAIRSDAVEYAQQCLGMPLTEGTLRQVIATKGTLERARESNQMNADLVLTLGDRVVLPVLWDASLDSRKPLEVIGRPSAGIGDSGLGADGVVLTSGDRPSREGCLIIQIEAPDAAMFIVNGQHERTATIKTRDCTVGSSPDVELTLDGSRWVSRSHVAIFNLGGLWYAVDNGSTNGTEAWTSAETGVGLAAGVPLLLAERMRLVLGRDVTLKLTRIEAPPALTGKRTEGPGRRPTAPLLTEREQLVGAALTAKLASSPGTDPPSIADLALRTGLVDSDVYQILETLTEAPQLREGITRSPEMSEWLRALAVRLLTVYPAFAAQRARAEYPLPN